MSTEAESGDTPDTESDADEQTDHELPRAFIVEASGPATKTTAVSENIREQEDVDELSISRRIETLEEFSQYYHVRNHTSLKEKVINAILKDETDPTTTAYRYDAADWSVQVDGRVGAFLGVIDVLEDEDIDVGMGTKTMSNTKRADIAKGLADLHVGMLQDSKTPKSAFDSLADNCHQSPLFGPGATLAYLDAKHGAGERLDRYVRRFADDLEENDG